MQMTAVSVTQALCTDVQPEVAALISGIVIPLVVPVRPPAPLSSRRRLQRAVPRAAVRLGSYLYRAAVPCTLQSPRPAPRGPDLIWPAVATPPSEGPPLWCTGVSVPTA